MADLAQGGFVFALRLDRVADDVERPVHEVPSEDALFRGDEPVERGVEGVRVDHQPGGLEHNHEAEDGIWWVATQPVTADVGEITVTVSSHNASFKVTMDVRSPLNRIGRIRNLERNIGVECEPMEDVAHEIGDLNGLDTGCSAKRIEDFHRHWEDVTEKVVVRFRITRKGVSKPAIQADRIQETVVLTDVSREVGLADDFVCDPATW